jgi:proline iminopeptidase
MHLHREIDPYKSGRLAVGEGHEVYWEACGNPTGKPALVLHGGPGSGCAPAWRRFFDPSVYRVILFDQRGCGRSTPHASDPSVDLASNTTGHLIADIELLRRHLEIEKWLLFGGSWGSTLGLAYAERHPHRVSEAVLFSVVTTTRREVQWVTRDVGRLFPEAWARFRDAVSAGERDGNLVEAYSRRLDDPDPSVREAAARAWCEWEQAHVALHADDREDPRYDEERFRSCFARLVTHYWRHAAFLEDGELLRNAGRLGGIPAVLVHGRLDVSSPLDVPWRLCQAWTGSELVVIDDAGHSAAAPGMTRALLTAIERFA